MSVSVVKTGERVLKMKGTDMKIGRPQIIIVPPGFLKTTTTMAPVKIAKISPKEPLKRPSPCLIESHLNPVRKRANLDHLSTEEKLLRRKLKNRVAAQNARDKKRVRMDDMEDEIRALRERNEKLEKENARLRELQARLEVPSEILDDCSLSATTTFELPLSPATSSSSEEEELTERTGDDRGASPTPMDLTSFSCKTEEIDNDCFETTAYIFPPPSPSSSMSSTTSILTPKREEDASSFVVGTQAKGLEPQDLDTFIENQIEENPFNSFTASGLEPLDTPDWEQSYNELFPDLI
ncbi:XBP1 [Lepeophtheirus salmonis]|uniref:X-box-binding protein 1 n=1 Tax=Lepeophtheirus salmonis TaxID=72036 RepID=A0A7R8CR82_LEPSM|nr:XBP1 [Lepeophtheirus salmonis]CAF2902642.1 XBP1 [Lepeophtheirus salmonis]